MIDIQPFIQLGHRRLQPYLSGVPDFLNRLDTPEGLKKTSLRSRPVDVYIRNILAVGVLSRIMRSEFLQTTRKLIVLPDCLKNYGDWECSKEDLENASVCAQCTPECTVYRVMDLFCDEKTDIVLEPEDMDSYFAEMRNRYGTVGIVGVACALTMLSGFTRTIKYRHPTQGIFLNYSSCAHHWADPAYNTDFSLRRLGWTMHNEDRSIEDKTENRGETYSLEKRPLSPDEFYRTLDGLSDIFEKEYLPRFKAACPGGDIYDICVEVQKAIVPDLITRESA